MADDVVVTGYSVLGAFGTGVGGLRSGPLAGRHAFRPVTQFDTTLFRAGYAATLDGLGRHSLRTTLVNCVRDALVHAGDPGRDHLSLLLGTQGDYAAVGEFWRSMAGGGAPEDGRLGDTAPTVLAEAVASEVGLGGMSLAFVNACIASTNAIIHGCRLIQAGVVDMVVCAGGSLVEQEVFAKFDSGHALTTSDRMRPFTRERSGLLLGDGAGALVLESRTAAARRGVTPFGVVAGWGMAADAFHIVRPHPDGRGMVTAISQALAQARIVPDRVDYVNAHGTATTVNDVAETAALRTVFGAHAMRLAVSSTKSTTGHMLEATGVVEAIICLQALNDGVCPPTAGYDEPDPKCDLDYVANEPRNAGLSYALTVNASFGGLNAALLLERP